MFYLLKNYSNLYLAVCLYFTTQVRQVEFLGIRVGRLVCKLVPTYTSILQLKLSTTATLGTEESGRCVGVAVMGGRSQGFFTVRRDKTLGTEESGR